MNRREALRRIAAAGAVSATALSTLADPKTAGENRPETGPAGKPLLAKNDVLFWLETSLKRVYPSTVPESVRPLRLKSARNYKLSFQACFHNRKTSSVKMKCEVILPDKVHATIRRVGFVPLPNFDTYTPIDELEGVGVMPGLCPDPLYPEMSAHIGPEGTGVFWISLDVPADAPTGKIDGKVRLTLENQFGYTGWENPKPWSVELPFEIRVAPLVVKPRKNFPVTQWISADSIWEYFHMEICGEPFWKYAEACIVDLTSHNVDVIFTPIFNTRAELLKRPAQLLRVRRTKPHTYEFDFSDVGRWIELAVKHGANQVEFSHFFSPAPSSGAFAQHIYERWGKGDIGPALWPPETPSDSDTYQEFLSQFLPAFRSFLEKEGVFHKSLFHCADEPDGDVQMANYRKARAVLKKLAPWMKVMDAMSDPRFATERLSDMPVPSETTAKLFAQAECPAWVYFCCGPRDRYLQRLLDTPLAKIRMSGWLFYRLKARGFLHWGYNYWFKFCTDIPGEPFQDSSNGAWPGMPYGDTFEVYPGPDAPLDSIRWEVFAESLQDYALLQSAGISPDDPILKDIRDYNDFPKTAGWLEERLNRLLG